MVVGVFSSLGMRYAATIALVICLFSMSDEGIEVRDAGIASVIHGVIVILCVSPRTLVHQLRKNPVAIIIANNQTFFMGCTKLGNKNIQKRKK